MNALEFSKLHHRIPKYRMVLTIMNPIVFGGDPLYDLKPGEILYCESGDWLFLRRAKDSVSYSVDLRNTNDPDNGIPVDSLRFIKYFRIS